jgi:DNA-binding PadR family transcriptional regulator
MPQRITRQLVALLEVLVSEPGREWYGLELIDTARLSSGTLYPLLHRLVADGWLERTREVPSDVGGTGRRLYTVTGLGARSAAAVLQERAAPARRQPRHALRPGAQIA